MTWLPWLVALSAVSAAGCVGFAAGLIVGAIAVIRAQDERQARSAEPWGTIRKRAQSALRDAKGRYGFAPDAGREA
jgi:hypothetical protein